MLLLLNRYHVRRFSINCAPCTKHQSPTNSFKNGGSANPTIYLQYMNNPTKEQPTVV